MTTYNQQHQKSKKWMNIFIVIPAIIFSVFFYQQNFGLNLLLFSVLTIIVLAIKTPKQFIQKEVLINALAYFTAGIAIFLYHSPLTITANFFAFFTLIGAFSEYKSSIYLKWINGIYTSIVAAFSLYFEIIQNETENVQKKKINYLYCAKTIGIPLIIILVFISLYRNGNPKFDELISKIDFSFINFQWLVFTGLGYYLFYNITHPITIEPANSIDLETKNELEKDNSAEMSPKKLNSEIQLGTILLVSLNILIGLFLVTDVMYLSEIQQMTAPELSKQVHTGVNALIISNLLAIAIILYFFRGDLNFVKNNGTLKKLTFSWILLNLIMIVITAFKNIEYIFSFGLTYKRIGVLFFLFFTAIGLITTFIKVTKVKNLWFIFRKNTQIAFTVLILSSTINWDKVVTHYNINNAEQLDLNYLIDLSNNNTFLLKDYIEKNNIDNQKRIKINMKHKTYITDLNDNSWQEFVFDNYKIQ